MKTDRQTGGQGLGLGLGTEGGPGQQPGGQRQLPSDEATARFERLLASESEKPAAIEQRPPLGIGPADAILRGLAPAPAGEPAAGLGPLVDAVAERVLVSDARFDARQEVRIKVKDSVFPGLEVRLRNEDGRLVVELVAAQSGDIALLRREAVGLLRTLRERLGREVELRFSVESPSGEPAEAGPDDGPDDAPPPLPRGPAG